MTDFSIYLIVIVPILYALLNALEFSATLARYSGVILNKTMLGYSLQNAVYIFTRFLVVLIMPILGFLIDSSVEPSVFILMAQSSLFLSFILGFIVLIFAKTIVRYYVRVIMKYSSSENFILCLVASLFSAHDKVVIEHPFKKYIQHFKQIEILKMTIISSLIFGVYGAGIFIAFYISLSIPEYRASISQMSGIINAFAAVILTFVVEPVISKRIDERAQNSAELVLSIYTGRLIGLLVIAQLLLLSITVFW